VKTAQYFRYTKSKNAERRPIKTDVLKKRDSRIF
jgi:hypothetical protein